MEKFDDKKQLPEHMTKGGPGDMFLGGGKVDTSKWFKQTPIGPFEEQIKDQDIWFCATPFQMLYSDVLGDYAPCSWATPFDANIRDTSLSDWFEKDPKLNQLREEMITPGSDLTLTKKTCAACMKQEKLYGRSRRQASMKIQTNGGRFWPLLRKAVERFKADGQGHIKDRIFEVQLKAFGNQCNLDCYMCMPYDSTTRIKSMDSIELETQKVFNINALINGELTKLNPIKNKSLDDVIDQITEMAPYIFNLKLIGGEPLVMKQFYKLLDAIVATGHAEHIQVKYQTNMSVLSHSKYNIINYLDKFAKFEFTVSLDGTGEANNYIRRKSDWEQILNNIKVISKYPKAHVCVNGAISFLSIMRFHELIKWFDDNSKDTFDQINWSMIRSPEKLGANVLPEAIKKKLIPKYANYPDIQNILKESNHGLDYQDTLDYLLMNDKYYKGTKWEMNLFDVFPELEEYHIPQDEKTDYELIGSSNE